MLGATRVLGALDLEPQGTTYLWISQTSGDTEIQCSLDKSDLWGH